MTATFAPPPVIARAARVRPTWVRVARGLTVGLTLVVVVVLARRSGLLYGNVALGLFILAMLAIPTSRQLSRRVLLGVCLAFGWIPLLWWAPLPVGDFGRATLLLATMVGGLGGWAAAGTRPWSRCKLVVPKLAMVDLFPPVLALLSAVVLRPWLQAKSGASSLSLLMGGWDHSAHFSMVRMIRQGGVTVDMAPPPASGGSWQFASYPQSFHAVTATIVEVLTGPRVGDLSTELNAFCQAIAIVTVLLVAMLAAGICALPVLRRRPAVTLPIATFVASVLIFGPGANAIQEGFVNFTFACALVAAVALLVVPMARVISPLHLAAIGGAVVGIANGWILLLVLAAPVALVGLFPFRRNRWSASRGRVVASGVLIVLVLIGVGRAALVVSRVPSDNVLLAKGGITPPGFGFTLIAVLACIALCVLVGWRRLAVPQRRISGSVARVRALIGLPFVAILSGASLAAFQLRNGSTLTYYFMKYITGVEIICLVIMMIPLAYIIARRTPQRRSSERANATVQTRPGPAISRMPVPAAASLALALAATQVFGFAAPNLTEISLPPTAPGALNRVSQNILIAHPSTATSLVDVAPRLNREYSGRSVFYFSFPSDRGVDPLIAAQWYSALTSTWVRSDNTVSVAIDFRDYTVEAVASSASRILNERPDAYVAVGAEQVDVIRGLLSPRVPADHVVAW